MNDLNPSIDRRRLLRNGTLVISMGALVAACGENRGGVEAPGRLGVAPAEPDARDTTVDDVVLLRTAQSLTFTGLAVYEAAGETGVLSGDAGALAERFVDDHIRHTELLGALITERGGEEFACANPFLMDRIVAPVLGALDGTDDLERDIFNIAFAFEELIGRSHQALVPSFEDPALRVAGMTIGTETQRHAAALASVMNPDVLINPALSGGASADTDAMNFPIRYAVPSTFGQLNGVPLTVGPLDDEGSRFSISLQTPAANSFVYGDLSC